MWAAEVRKGWADDEDEVLFVQISREWGETFESVREPVINTMRRTAGKLKHVEMAVVDYERVDRSLVLGKRHVVDVILDFESFLFIVCLRLRWCDRKSKMGTL